MLRYLIILASIPFSYSLSYVCTYQNRDYYGNDELGFQFPNHLIKVNQEFCSRDCMPYEPMTLQGKDFWVGYQSLCTFHPVRLEEYELDEYVDNVTNPYELTFSQEGVYVSYPSVTLCISKQNPC